MEIGRKWWWAEGKILSRGVRTWGDRATRENHNSFLPGEMLVPINRRK